MEKVPISKSARAENVIKQALGRAENVINYIKSRAKNVIFCG